MQGVRLLAREVRHRLLWALRCEGNLRSVQHASVVCAGFLETVLLADVRRLAEEIQHLLEG